MQHLNIIDDLFISVAFAEERIFKPIVWGDLLKKINQTLMAIAFAEEGTDPAGPLGKRLAKKPTGQCTIGDISCFLTRNA